MTIYKIVFITKKILICINFLYLFILVLSVFSPITQDHAAERERYEAAISARIRSVESPQLRYNAIKVAYLESKERYIVAITARIKAVNAYNRSRSNYEVRVAYIKAMHASIWYEKIIKVRLAQHREMNIQLPILRPVPLLAENSTILEKAVQEVNLFLYRIVKHWSLDHNSDTLQQDCQDIIQIYDRLSELTLRDTTVYNFTYNQAVRRVTFASNK